MKRSLVIAVAAVASVTVPAAAVSADQGGGELNSAFRTEVNQFRVDLSDAPPLVRPEGHLSPFVSEPASVCDELIVGTWISLLDFDRAELARTTWDITLDGEPLDVVQTPVRKRKLTDSSAGQSLLAFTRGTPVIGTLDEGVHVLEYVFYEDGIPVFVATRDIDSSPSHC
jgi:hypothetical protein